jgi:hypothetical protein
MTTLAGRSLSLLCLLSAASAVGCRLDEVSVRGEVQRERDPRLIYPLEGGTVEIRSDDGTKYDEAITDGDGEFRALAPASSTIFAAISGDGLGQSSFTGVSGVEENMTVEPGALYGVSLAELDAIRAMYAGCPGSDLPMGLVVGEVRVYGLSDPETGESPLVTTARAVATRLDGEEIPACYLDPTGLAYDPAAEITGLAGSFAIFGLESELYSLTVMYSVTGESEYVAYWEIWVPPGESGVVPRYPAWVEFPF